MKAQSTEQVRAFAGACLNRGLDIEAAKKKAGERWGKSFSELSWQETYDAIAAINSLSPRKPVPEEAAQRSFDEWLIERAELSKAEVRAIDRLRLDRWNEAFGDDFEATILPIVYAVRRPASRAWFVEWCALFEIDDPESRRSALFALLGRWLGNLALATLEAERVDQISARSGLETRDLLEAANV